MKTQVKRSQLKRYSKNRVVKRQPTSRPLKIAGMSQRKDTALKLLFEDNRIFAEVFNKTVFHKDCILPDTLQDMNTDESSFISIKGNRVPIQYHRDVLKGVLGKASDSLLSAKIINVNGENLTILAILGVENQMHVDYSMPLRVMQTRFINYSRQANDIERNNKLSGAKTEGADNEGEYMSHFLKTDRLIRVICLVVYYGVHPWDGPKSLEDMYAADGLPSLGESNPLNILEVRFTDDDVLCEFSPSLRPFFGYLTHDRIGDIQQFINNHTDWYENMLYPVPDALAEIVGTERIKWIVENNRTKSGGVNFVDGLEKAIQKAEQKKENETRNETIAEMVKKMIKSKVIGSIISECSGYDRNQIDSIAKKMNLSVSW